MSWKNIIKWHPPEEWYREDISTEDSKEGEVDGLYLVELRDKSFYVATRPHYIERGEERSTGLPKYELETWVDSLGEYSSQKGRFWFYVNDDENDFRFVDFTTAQPGNLMHGLQIDFRNGNGYTRKWPEKARGPLLLFNTYRGGKNKTDASGIPEKATQIPLFYEGIKPGHEKFKGESKVGVSFEQPRREKLQSDLADVKQRLREANSDYQYRKRNCDRLPKRQKTNSYDCSEVKRYSQLIPNLNKQIANLERKLEELE